MEKSEYRSLVLNTLKQLSKETLDQSQQEIEKRIKAYINESKPRVIFIYVGVNLEIKTWELILFFLKNNIRVAVPLCLEAGKMVAKIIQGPEDIESGRFGLLEPKKICPTIQAKDIDLILLPALACSLKGKRLGYGGGYYDRYLLQTKAKKIALCWERFIYQELPADPWDISVDGIISEKREILF